MSEETKFKIAAAAQATKHEAWRWLGALIMRPKTDAQGNTHLAVSLTKLQKLLSIVMACVLFAVMVVLWIVKPEAVVETASVTDPIPASMMNAFWALLGLTGVNMTAGAIAFKNGAKD